MFMSNIPTVLRVFSLFSGKAISVIKSVASITIFIITAKTR